MTDTYEKFRVEIGLEDAIDHNLEGFLDLIAEKAGHPLLMDINYEVAGVTQDGSIVLNVTGDTSMSEEDQ